MIVIAGSLLLGNFSSCDTEDSIYPDGINTYMKIYGYGRLDVAADMIRDEVNGGFVIAGTTFIGPLDNIEEWENAEDNDAMVIFMDENGNDARYAVKSNPPVDGNELVHQIIQKDDGNFLIVGETISSSTGETSVFLWEVDNMGIETSFGYKTYDLGRGLGVMEYIDANDPQDNRIIVTGETRPDLDGNTKQLLMLLTADGDSLHTLGEGTGINNLGNRTRQSVYRYSTNPERYGFRFTRNELGDPDNPDDQGNIKYVIAHTSLGPNGQGQNNGLMSSTTGSIYTPGLSVDFIYNTDEFNPANPGIYVLSKSNAGDVRFTTWIGSSDGTYTIRDGYDNTLNFDVEGSTQQVDPLYSIRSKSGKFILCGTATATELNNKILISNFSDNGTVHWSKVYGTEGDYGLGGDVVEMEDGSLVFCGTVYFENDNLKIVLYKTDSEGNLDM